MIATPVLITTRLAAIAAERNLRILFACESGSRAWGFASADSDYDVRFIYLQRPEVYLSLGERRDSLDPVIDGDLDFAGWDIRKALGLFLKSNGPLYEWLQSPVVYQAQAECAESLRTWIPDYYCPRACFCHYLNMARGKFKDIQAEPRPSAKTLLYCLRPLLACRWLEGGRGPVPTECQRLVDTALAGHPLATVYAELVAQKAHGRERDGSCPAPKLLEFLALELARLETVPPLPLAANPDRPRLDKLFQDLLKTAWKLQWT